VNQHLIPLVLVALLLLVGLGLTALAMQNATRTGQAIPQDEPIIFTSKGNVPESSLEQYVEWTDTPEEVVFRWICKDKATGEVVKCSPHVLKRQGAAVGAAQQSF
jgi:hypothetical protein